MALGAQVVNLIRLYVAQQHVDRAGVVQVTVVQEHAHILLVRIAVEMVDAAGVERG